MQIAAQHSEAVSKRSRVRVKKWLLLNRIALHAGNVAPGNVECAATVEANLANTGLTFGDWATMAAGIAADAIAIQSFPQGRVAFADAGVSSENVAQRGHKDILRLGIGSVRWTD